MTSTESGVRTFNVSKGDSSTTRAEVYCRDLYRYNCTLSAVAIFVDGSMSAPIEFILRSSFKVPVYSMLLQECSVSSSME